MNELNIARDTDDTEVLKELSTSLYVNIRRLVAKNINTPKEILERLSFDPVMNVSYMAINNPNNNLTRDFEKSLHPCVVCKEDESSINCRNCDLIKEYKVS